jgi:urea transport system permease protein
MTRTFLARNPSVLWFFLAILSLFTLTATVLSEGFGIGLISTSFVKTLGKTLCLCLVAIAMDLIWGYAGILCRWATWPSFALGGYMIGMWLMYARTEEIVVTALSGQPIPPTRRKSATASGADLRRRRRSDMPPVWSFAHSLPRSSSWWSSCRASLRVFGWLAFRSRVTGVYLSILTQAMTLALALWLFQNDSGLRGNNGLSGLQNLPGLIPRAAIHAVGLVLLGLGRGAGRGLPRLRLGRVGQVRVRHPRHPR